MIKFIDLGNGLAYDGSQPYVHYIGNGLSTNVFYSKTFVMISDNPSDIYASTDSTFISLVNPDFRDSEGNLKELSEIESKSLYISKEAEYTTGGVTYYIYQMQIVVRSETEGEVHDTIDLTHNDSKITIEVAGDFYGEDEISKINLLNKGISIPDDIERAFYESDVHDMVRDNILMNEKNKELLLEYFRIFANRGSYESLINSKNFFGYGDLLRIEEYFNSIDDFNIKRMFARNMELEIFDDIYETIDLSAKTTYIGLMCALDGLKYENGEVVYKNDYKYDTAKEVNPLNEPVPELINVALKHTKDDMALKMTLVGNYFSSYFMPIHLDLINSTIENVVYSATIKIQRGARLMRSDFFNNLGTFDCSLRNDNVFYLKNETTYTYPSTIARNYLDDFTSKVFDSQWEPKVNIFGVDLVENGVFPIEPVTEDGVTVNRISDDNLKNFLMQTFSGVATIVPVKCKMPTMNTIRRLHILIHRSVDGGQTFDFYDELISRYPIEMSSYDLNFNILFKQFGVYHISFVFTQISSVDLIGNYIIEVHDDTRNEIRLQKLRRRNDVATETGLYQTFAQEKVSFNRFMFTNGPLLKDMSEGSSIEPETYTQWLRKNTSLIDDSGCGMNHTIIKEIVKTGNPNRKSYPYYITFDYDTLNRMTNLVIHEGNQDGTSFTERSIEDIREFISGLKFISGDDAVIDRTIDKEGLIFINQYKDKYYADNYKTLDFNAVLEDMRLYYPHYFWRIERRYKDGSTYSNSNDVPMTEDGMPEPDGSIYLIGVRKYFDIDMESETVDINGKQYEILSQELFRKTYCTPEGDEKRISVMFNSGVPKVSEALITFNTDGVEILGEMRIYDDKDKLIRKEQIDINGELKLNALKVSISNIRIEIDMDYTVFGPPVHETITFSPYSAYGAENLKFVPHRKKNFMTIDESRFYPSFHTLVDVEDRHIGRNDVVVCRPTYILQDRAIELDSNPYWEFVNRSTGEIFQSQLLKNKTKKIYVEEPFVGIYDYYNELTPGYYDVILHYKLGGRDNVSHIDSAFVIE